MVKEIVDVMRELQEKGFLLTIPPSMRTSIWDGKIK